MLETIREYGLERFHGSLERDEIRMRHAQHAVARAKSNRDEELLPWLASIDPQYADLLAALTWLAETESSVLLLQLASRLGRYWDGRTRLAEGRRWLDLALERGPTATTPERAEALSRLGHIAWRQGDLGAATAAIGAAQAAAAELGDEGLCARQHMHLGAVAVSMDDLEVAEAEYVRAIELLRARNDTRELAVATHDLGLLAMQRGDYASSRKLIQESIQLARANLDVGSEANATGTLGFIELGEGQFDRAKELLLEALQLERGIDHLNLGSANNLVGLAAIAAAHKHFEDACFFVGAYDGHRELVGASHETFVRDLLKRVLAQVSSQLGKEEIEEAKARGAELSLAEAVDRTLAATASTHASGGSRSVSRTS
jgi:non-specific serine/threonine protein kinase